MIYTAKLTKNIQSPTLIPNFSGRLAFFLIFFAFVVCFPEINTIFANSYYNSFKLYRIMNKTELISAIAEKANLSKVDAKAALDAMIEAIGGALENNDKVAILGFGTFSVNEKPARTGINPQTKQKIEIAARKVVKFKPGAELAAKVK